MEDVGIWGLGTGVSGCSIQTCRRAEKGNWTGCLAGQPGGVGMFLCDIRGV